jgi:hypothetical protein
LPLAGQETPDADALTPSYYERQLPRRETREAPYAAARRKIRIRSVHPRRHFVLPGTGRLCLARRMLSLTGHWLVFFHSTQGLHGENNGSLISCDWIRPPAAVSGRTQRGLSSPRRCPGLQNPKTQRLLRGGDVVSPERDNPDVSVPRPYCTVITAFNCRHETSRGGFAFVKNNAPPPTSIMGNMVSDLPISVRGGKNKFCHAGPETPCRFLTCSRYPA